MSRLLILTFALFLGTAAFATHAEDSTTASVVSKPSEAPVPVGSPEEQAEVLKVKADDIILGQAGAPVTIVEYSSLSCPHCAHFHKEILPKIEKDFIEPGKAKLVIRPFPLNKPALDAAKLVACVEPSRATKFEEVLFKMQEQWAFSLKDDTDSLRGIAGVGGLPEEQFNKCMGDKALEDKILATENDAKNILGVASTPTFFVNGQKLEGAQPVEKFGEAITKALSATEDSTKAK